MLQVHGDRAKDPVSDGHMQQSTYQQLAHSVRKVRHAPDSERPPTPRGRWWTETKGFVDWMRGKQPLPRRRRRGTLEGAEGMEDDDFDPENIARPEQRRRSWRFWQSRRAEDSEACDPKPASSIIIELPQPQGERVRGLNQVCTTTNPNLCR